MTMISSLSIHHPLLTIPEEDQSACSEYSVPSDCNCFTDAQKSNEKKITYQNNSTNVIQGNKGCLLPGSRKTSSNKKNNICDETEDSIFAWRLMTIREKLEVTLLNVYLSISNIPEPDGLQDFIRRRQRAAEFTSRFCRNYLYQFHRQVLALRHRLREKSCCGLQYIYKATMCQKLLNAYELAHLALQALLNHIPTSILMCIPKKLREFLKLIIELTEISSKSGVISCGSEDSGDEIAKYCRDLLMLVPDSSESLNIQNENSNRGYDRRALRNCGKFPLVSRFSMYNENSTMKRKNTVLRSVSKKSEVSGKESRTSLESCRSSHKSSHLSRFNEMSVTKPKLTKNCSRKKREDHSKVVERVSEKNHIRTPFNMDNVATVIETISAAKCEDNFTGDERNPGFTENITISSGKNTEPTNNTAVIKCQNKPNNKMKFQTSSSNVKLIILPPFEESDKVSRGRNEEYTPSQATVHTKTEDFGNNVCKVLIDSGPIQKVKDTQVIFPGEHILQSPIKDYSQDASLPPQSLFEPLHLEEMVTHTKGCNQTQDAGTKAVKETFTAPVIELEGKKSVMLDPPDNSLHLEKMATCEKGGDSYLLGPDTVPVQGNNPKHLNSISNTDNTEEHQGNGPELSDTISKTNTEISQNVVLLKIPTTELECILEHKKRFVQCMNNNPLYMNSAKPWIIVSRLADTLISDVMLEVMSEIELETDKTVTQMFHLELE